MTLQQLLEALETPQDILNAVSYGRIVGVSSKTSISEDQARRILDNLKDLPRDFKDKAIKLALRRGDLTPDIGTYKTYFTYRGSKGAKTKYKELFDKFESGEIDDDTFNKEIRANFSLKAEAKDSIKLYEDERWFIVIPKTFESSCKYGASTKWCTTGSESTFNKYSGTTPLIIIIDKTKDPLKSPAAKIQLSLMGAYGANSYGATDCKDARDRNIDFTKWLKILPKEAITILRNYGFDQQGYAIAIARNKDSGEDIIKAVAAADVVPAIAKLVILWAMGKGYYSIINHLIWKRDHNAPRIALRGGIDIDWKNQPKAIIDILKSYGVNPWTITLNRLLRRGTTEKNNPTIIGAIESGAEISEETANDLLTAATRGNNIVLLDYLLEKKIIDLKTLEPDELRWACRWQFGYAANDAQVLERIVSIVGVNNPAVIASFISAFELYWTALKYFIDWGIDINHPDIVSAVAVAVQRHSDVRSLEIVLDAGLNINQPVMQEAFLQLCKRLNRQAELRLFLSHGFDVHYNDDEALYKACSSGFNEDIASIPVKILLSYGADIHAKKDRVLKYVRRTGKTTLLSIMLEYENEKILGLTEHRVDLLKFLLRNRFSSNRGMVLK